MREILFRGRIPQGNWSYGGLIQSANNFYISIGIDKGFICAYVKSETVGQYTGLTDKDGKKIFEGDILRRAYHPEDDVVIEWFDGSFRFRKANKPKDYGYSAVCCIQNAVSSLKIIGNAYDNPELLEEQ